jgi:creatinine amidohydrolase
MWPLTEETAKFPVAMRASRPGVDGHGGEERISALMAYYPDLVHLDRAHDEPIAPAGRKLNLPRDVLVRVSGSADHGDPSGATAVRGKALMEYSAHRAAEAIRAVKADEESPRLQKEFFEKILNPAE